MDGLLVPDDALLGHIFPDNQPSSFSIILNNFDKCIFKAVLPNALSNGQRVCAVRLEALNGKSTRFAMVAAMQEIAATYIPGIVPETFQVGKTVDENGREFEFSVIEFIEGTTLEEVWEHMIDEDQKSVTAAIVEAQSMLQQVRLSDAKVQTILHRALDEGDDEVLKKAALGGPWTGFLDNGPALLSAIKEGRKLDLPFYTVDPIADPKGVVIRSNFEDFGSTIVSDSDMEQWPKEAVFCHNDLSPRNLILQSSTDASGNTRYKLASIIDWELAGFYPPSYQLSLQDTYLGTGNRHLLFYLLLKKGLKDIAAPPTPSQIALLRAMELIFESRQQWLFERNNVPANMRKKFSEVLRLYRDEDPYVGLNCKTEGGPVPAFSFEDFDKLENECIAECKAKRKAKAKQLAQEKLA
ncbi:hypothetical protein B0T17DRAFT_520154 [Bombardia bombarda]|uniref:Aminoglycoside phosphotransferase domain-containing protein n=1 Tax=Bombardia bombarda TaxID=252184 RepID=A0AA40CGY9_9PEZI|nr:hypothetical protein B0T17DRAFT_520154 [Bombardia bombarda]